MNDVIYLPLPRIRKNLLSVEEAFAYRRSIRNYRNEPLTIEQLSQLLWTTYGISHPGKELKTSPSAGATYPLNVYVVVKTNGVKLENGKYLEPGIYKYDWRKHALINVKKGDYSKELSRACLDQSWVFNAPVNIVLTAVFERTTMYYGERGVRYVYIDTGHAGQNIYLEATALGLGTVAVGAFIDDEVSRVIGLEPGEKPVYVFPVGVPVKTYIVKEEDIHEYINRFRK
ncbi:MAG: SagB/ThcOx family dehydrogenase [Desulfurococcaceae archaeon]